MYIESYLSNNVIRGEGKGIITADNSGEIVTWQAYDSGQLLNSNESDLSWNYFLQFSFSTETFIP
jgi:hypothetical protein